MTPSPCIGRCELDPELVCQGCFRTLAEISRWLRLSDLERQRVLAEAAKRRREKEPGQAPGS